METKVTTRQVNKPAAQNGAIYDAPDFRMMLHRLNELGFDLETQNCHYNAHQLFVTCRKTKNRFVVNCIGNNEWPTRV
jgi:hypothetical protein